MHRYRQVEVAAGNVPVGKVVASDRCGMLAINAHRARAGGAFDFALRIREKENTHILFVSNHRAFDAIILSLVDAANLIVPKASPSLRKCARVEIRQECPGDECSVHSIDPSIYRRGAIASRLRENQYTHFSTRRQQNIAYIYTTLAVEQKPLAEWLSETESRSKHLALSVNDGSILIRFFVRLWLALLASLRSEFSLRQHLVRLHCGALGVTTSIECSHRIQVALGE